MKALGFILALISGAAVGQEAISNNTVSGADSGSVHWQAGETAYLQPSSPAALLEERLDEVARELDAALEQRLAERAAAIIAGDRLLVSTDSQ